MNVQPGRVIILNGASSSGKSTVGRALQMALPAPYLFSGIDFFTPMLPPVGHIGMMWDRRTNANSAWPDAPLRWVFPENQGGPVVIEFGESGHRLIRGMHRAIAALARAGNNVIVEHVFLYEEWVDDLGEALDGLDVWMVAVRCPLEIIEERERSRANRVAGQARAHYESVYRRAEYDIEVDTSAGQPRDAALAIAEALESLGESAAFQRMRQR
jgi:chloramphenicol 3-O phosphotransferase